MEVLAFLNLVLSLIAGFANLILFVRRSGYMRWIRLAYALDMLAVFVIYVLVVFDGGVSVYIIRMAIFLLLITILSSTLLSYFDCDDVLHDLALLVRKRTGRSGNKAT